VKPFEHTLERTKVSTFFEDYEWEVFAVEALNKLEYIIEEDIWDWIADGNLDDKNFSNFMDLWAQRPFENMINSSDFDKEKLWWNWSPDDSGVITEEAWEVISKTINVFLAHWFENGGMGTYYDNIENIEELKNAYGPPVISLEW
jgi:hypothetical protein